MTRAKCMNRNLLYAVMLGASLLTLVAAPQPAQANKKLAKKMLKEAKAKLKAGDHDAAINRLTAAWDLVPQAKIAKTLVKAYEKKGDLEAAVTFLEDIRSKGKPKKLRKWAKKKLKGLAKVRKKLAAKREREAAEKAATEAAADEAALAEEERRRRNAQARSKKAAEAKDPAPTPPKAKEPAADDPAKEVAATEATGSKKEGGDTPSEEPAAVAEEIDEDMQSSYVPPPDPTIQLLAWTAAVVAALSTGAAGYFLFDKLDKRSEADACADNADLLGGRCAEATYDDLVAGMNSARKLELISWAAAVASAATAAGLFYWSPPVDEDVSAIIVPFPQGLLLRSSF